MNIMNLSTNGLSARFFAVLTIVSLLVSALPVAFFVAEASTEVYRNDLGLVAERSTGRSFGIIDATNFTDMFVSFNYDMNDAALNALEDGETVAYGYRNEGEALIPLGTLTAGPGAFSGSIVDLPLGPQADGMDDMSVAFIVTGADDSDQVAITNFVITGDLIDIDSVVVTATNPFVDGGIDDDDDTIDNSLELNVDFTVLSENGDIFVSTDPAEALIFGVFDDAGNEITPAEVLISRSDSSETPDFFKFEAGEAGDIYLEVKTGALPSGDYRLEVTGLNYSVIEGGETRTLMFNPADDFKTDFVVIESSEDEDPYIDEDPGPTGPATGDLRVCKIVVDAEGNIIDGGDTPADFSVNVTGPNDFDETVTFTTALTLNTNLVNDNDDADDAECVIFEDVKTGEYTYSAEEITSDSSWAEPLYHDSFTRNPETLADFALLTVDGSDNDNDDTDGVINLRNNKSRTLAILNAPEVVIEPEVPSVCSFDGIASATQGMTNAGNPVDTNRSNLSAVQDGPASYANFLGKEGNVWVPTDFYSMGIGGEFVFEFTNKVAIDQAGADIAIWETTGGTSVSIEDETANVFLSSNGVDYELAGTVSGDGTVDISNTSLDFVKFVKLVDKSSGVQGDNGDGYDIDAITIIEGSCSDFATINTTKIVCDLESELPNWGGGSANITETTASDWMAANTDTSCRVVEGWEFEWAPKSASNPGNDLVGTGGAEWNTFVGTGIVPASVIEADNSFWMREVLQADYIPFAGGKNDVSAEMYCHSDVLNYDNFDRIDRPEVGADYYCVAWNVPVETDEMTSEVTMCKYDQNDNPLSGWTLALLGENVDNIAVQPDGSTQTLANVTAGEYVLKATGAYKYRGGTSLLADARFSERKAGDVGFGTYPNQPWREASGTTGGLAVQVNADLGVLWGSTFSPSHTYYGSLSQALTSDVDFYVYDNAYSDNVGDIDVSVFAGRTGITGDNGCVTFTDVPYGNYVVEELLQADWTNLSGLGQVKVDAETEVFNVKNTNFVAAPYCGDGEVNQKWEQCEVGDAGCTNYCTLDNQCSDLQLAKITLTDAPQSSTFDGTIRLGSADNIIPSGTWFNLNETDDDEADDIAKDTEGLAIERNNGELIFAVEGNDNSKDFDYVFGNLMTLGTDLGSVDQSPVVGWPLEKNTDDNPDRYKFPDVFDKTNDEGVDFEFYMTSGSDSASVLYTATDELYDCPACKATVEARVVLNENGQTGNGDLNERVILGDAGYTTVEFGEWFPVSVIEPGDTSATMINDPNTVTNFDNPEDKAGLFVSREDGTVKVALVGNHNPGGNVNNEWIDARIEIRDAEITNFSNLSGSFKLENHSETDGVPTNDLSDVVTPVDDNKVDFRLWVDTQSDGFRFDIDNDSIAACVDDSVDKMIIDGHKYEVTVAFDDGDAPAQDLPVGNWLIELFTIDGDTPVATTTTDSNGYYSFDVVSGDYRVFEEMQSGWSQEVVFRNGQQQKEDYCRVEADRGPDFLCDFYNMQDDGGGNGGNDDTYTVTGFKYNDVNGNGVLDDGEVGEAGWIMTASNGDTSTTTETSTNGSYSFTLSAGSWTISEEDRKDWTQTQVLENGSPAEASEEDLEMRSCRFKLASGDSADSVNTCNFYNQLTGSDDGGNGGTDDGGSNGDGGNTSSGNIPFYSSLATAPAGEVLGAATSVETCPFLIDWMQMGAQNDTMEVMKLQLFLNIFKDTYGGTINPVTGTFGIITDTNVKRFQEAYRDEVLTPWFNEGIVGHTKPTGFVYKTTLWKINDIVCGAVFPSLAGETLDVNVDKNAAAIED